MRGNLPRGGSFKGSNTKPVPPAWDGVFTSLVSGAYQGSQGDKLLTYGPTPFPTTGNTSTTALTLSGTLTLATPVPIQFKATNTLAIGAGAQFSVSFDGGSTFPMAGVTPVAGTPVALTGPGLGVSCAWSAGSSVANNTWNATCANWGDTSGSGNDWVAVSAPIVTVGLNGKCGLKDTSAGSAMRAVSMGLPTNANSPVYVWTLMRVITWQTNRRLIDGDNTDAAYLMTNGVTPTFQMRWGGAFHIDSTALPVGTFARLSMLYTGSDPVLWPNNDAFKVGSASPVAGSLGAGTFATGRQIFSNLTVGQIELLAVLHCTVDPNDAQKAALDAAATVWTAGGVQV